LCTIGVGLPRDPKLVGAGGTQLFVFVFLGLFRNLFGDKLFSLGNFFTNVELNVISKLLKLEDSFI
jgi:hypothetical protein